MERRNWGALNSQTCSGAEVPGMKLKQQNSTPNKPGHLPSAQNKTGMDTYITAHPLKLSYHCRGRDNKIVRAWPGQPGLHNEILYQYFQREGMEGQKEGGREGEIKREKKRGRVARCRNSGRLQPNSMSQTCQSSTRSSHQPEVSARDQANQNLSMSRGGASEAPPLVEDLLATGGLWGRESQDIVKDAP